MLRKAKKVHTIFFHSFVCLILRRMVIHSLFRDFNDCILPLQQTSAWLAYARALWLLDQVRGSVSPVFVVIPRRIVRSNLALGK